jgi:hypothetical protein
MVLLINLTGSLLIGAVTDTICRSKPVINFYSRHYCYKKGSLIDSKVTYESFELSRSRHRRQHLIT